MPVHPHHHIGNLTANPELRFTPSGQAVASFTLAENKKKKTENGWQDDYANFLRVTVWDDLAENVAESLRGGMEVIVVGQLQVKQYTTKDGGKGTSVDLTAQWVGPALNKATAQVTKKQSHRNGSNKGSGTWGDTTGPWSDSSTNTAPPADDDPWGSAPAPADNWGGGATSTPEQQTVAAGGEEPPF